MGLARLLLRVALSSLTAGVARLCSSLYGFCGREAGLRVLVRLFSCRLVFRSSDARWWCALLRTLPLRSALLGASYSLGTWAVPFLDLITGSERPHSGGVFTSLAM